jgi:hypothetical protein
VAFRTSVERMGDEANCAELYFVNELLSQLLLVTLQDGVYFVGDVKYRNKPWATFRVDLLGPNYEQWALEKYAWARAELKRYNQSRFSNNWESKMTGDVLRGDTMENKDEVMEGVKRKHNSPKLTKVNQRVSPSKMHPAPRPILIPATPQHPSTPQRQWVPLLPRRTCLSNIVALSPPLVECQNQNIHRALAYPALRIESPEHQQQHHDSGWLQNTPTASGLDSNSIFSEEELNNRDLSAPDQPNNRWPNHLPKSVELLVQDYYAKKMFEDTCNCRNRQIVNKWTTVKNRTAYVEFTKRDQIWKKIANLAGLEPRNAHLQYDKMVQVAIGCHWF